MSRKIEVKPGHKMIVIPTSHRIHVRQDDEKMVVEIDGDWHVGACTEDTLVIAPGLKFPLELTKQLDTIIELLKDGISCYPTKEDF